MSEETTDIAAWLRREASESLLVAASVKASNLRRAYEQEAARYRQAAEAVEREAGLRWQPIETAPKDGTRILVPWRSHDGRVEAVIAKWVLGDWCGVDRPTHWMPLPLPPAGGENA